MKEGRIKLLAVLAVSGIAFSGYLSGVRFFSQTCAFNEGCPYFLGYPACYFGFSAFVLIGIAILMYAVRAMTRGQMLGTVAILSGAGTLFAAYFTIPEMPLILAEGVGAYMLGLPTCAYGLLAFIAVFVISLLALQRGR